MRLVSSAPLVGEAGQAFTVRTLLAAVGTRLQLLRRSLRARPDEVDFCLSALMADRARMALLLSRVDVRLRAQIRLLGEAFDLASECASMAECDEDRLEDLDRRVRELARFALASFSPEPHALRLAGGEKHAPQPAGWSRRGLVAR